MRPPGSDEAFYDEVRGLLEEAYLGADAPRGVARADAPHPQNPKLDTPYPTVRATTSSPASLSGTQYEMPSMYCGAPG